MIVFGPDAQTNSENRAGSAHRINRSRTWVVGQFERRKCRVHFYIRRILEKWLSLPVRKEACAEHHQPALLCTRHGDLYIG